MNTLKETLQFWFKEDAAPEAPANAPLGQYAFATNRSDVPPEPNTQFEDELGDAVALYLNANVKRDLGKLAPEVMQLVRNGYYKKVLSPDQYTTAYRMLQVKKEEAAQLLQTPLAELPPSDVKGPGVLEPLNSLFSGWTVTKHFLNDFESMGNGDTVMIFQANIHRNQFFGNPGELAKAVGEKSFAREMETLALGPVQYDRCAYAILTPQEQQNDSLAKKRISQLLLHLR